MSAKMHGEQVYIDFFARRLRAVSALSAIVLIFADVHPQNAHIYLFTAYSTRSFSDIIRLHEGKAWCKLRMINRVTETIWLWLQVR